MALRRFLGRIFRTPFRLEDQPRQSRRRRLTGARPLLEALEERVVPSLLNLAASATRPDIASGALTHLSYTQVGNDANPFHYDAAALSITLTNGSRFNFGNPTGGSRSTRLDLVLDNSGHFVSGVAGPDLAISGKVTIAGHTYDGTLLTAEAENFGFSDTITPARGEFDVRLQITGGLLTQSGGPYTAGDDVAVLIHQPGLPITSFPNTFTITSTSGSSDTLHIPTRTNRLSQHTPLTPGDRPPTNDASAPTPPPPSPDGCGCNNAATSGATGASQDTGGQVSLYNGSVTEQVVDLRILGRGFDWSLTRTYRSDLQDDGPVGQGWEMNGDRHLEVVSAANLAKFQSAVPSAQVGDVDLVDGYGRDDFYVHNLDGSYTSPAGFYSRLVMNADGTFAERFANGTVYTYSRSDDHFVATVSAVSERNGNTMRYVYDDDEKLVFQYDTLGRSLQYHYDASGRLTEVRDYTNRSVRYSYDANGDLVSVTSPSVTGTPNGNDFPTGRTTRYTYSSGFADDRLNHDLLTVTAPNEVANGGPPRVVFTYDTNPGLTFDHVTSQQLGGTNASGVPSGGTIVYTYEVLATPPPGDTNTPARRTTVTDRNGNITQYEYNQLNNTVGITEEANRGVRAGDPSSFQTHYTYDADYRLTSVVLPMGNSVVYTYDTANPDRYQQGNLLSETRLPDAARGGDQSAITTSYTYEPIYNQVRTMTDPRGNDASYVPQNGGANSPARYTTVYTYDYQEGTNFAALGNILGVSAAEAAARLAAAGVPMGLGDVNGDGCTDQVSGNVIRVQAPTVHLLPGSNEAAVEGTTLQPIVTLYAYNNFGQLTRSVDPEQNVTTYTYYSERDPNGDGIIDNPSGNTSTGGYLKQVTIDASTGPGRDSSTNPPATSIRHVYQYDALGDVTRYTDGRGIRTDYVYNQLNELVQVTHAAAHNAFTPAPTELLPLTDFRYLERFFYDANGNMVLHQVEDCGNTSNVDGNPSAADLPTNAPNPDPVGGPAFVDTVYKYDILDRPVEVVQEASNGTSPEFLHTRFRYDPNGNMVLTIRPEGNASTAIYDERDLLFHTSRGEDVAPPLTLLSPTDPTNYDVRGASCQCTTFRYDANANLIETVDDDDTDLSSANNDPSLGAGDRTRYVYDGFDRQTSVIDAVGNQTVMQYDPDGNVIRTTRFGPTGGPSPTSDGPGTLPGPVSSNGVIQSGNLVNSNLLRATEYFYDELGRTFQTSQVLFINTIPTARAPDVAEGSTDPGKGSLTPGQTQPIPGVGGVTVLGRVSERTEYDRDSRVTFQVQDDLDTTRTFYDGAGRVIKTIDPQGNTVQTAYDDNSNVIETRQTDVAQIPGVANEVFLTTNFYDSLNRLQQQTDNIGQTTYYRYDSRDNLVATADAQGPMNGATVTRRAFAGGAKTVNAINDFGNVTRYFYDGLDRKVRQEEVLTSSPGTPGSTAGGDGVHIGASIFGVKDDPSAPDSFTPTPDTAQGGGDGLIRTGWTYDQNSNVSSIIDDQGNVTLYLYDNLDRRVSQTNGLVTTSGPLDHTTVFGGRVIPTPTAATIDNPTTIANSQIDAQLAEAQARIAVIAALFPPLADRVDDHPPTSVIWGYSQEDNVLIYEDANDSETFTRYDALNRPIDVRVFRSGQSDSFIGNPDFAPNPASDPSNPSTTFPAVEGTTIQDFQYDGLSRMVRATDNNDPSTPADDSVVTGAYDSLSRVIEETQQIGSLPVQAVDSAWRAENLRTRLIYPNGRTEAYTYDKLDRPKTVGDLGASQPIATYDYIGADRVLQRRSPQDGTRETYLNNAGNVDVGYDGLARPVQLRSLRSNNSIIVGFTYTYDRGNHVLSEGKLHDAPNGETFGYDSAGRLIAFGRGAGGQTPIQSHWTLDGAGNWTQVDAETRKHSSFNEITQRNNGSTTTDVLSDDNGNETDDGTFLYTYDAHNRVRTVTRKSDNAPIAVYSYDALGRRIEKVVTNSGAQDGTTYFYLDGWQEVEAHNAGDVLTQQVVFGNYIDEPLVLDRNLNADGSATGAGDQRLFYHQNAMYSVHALTDTSARIVEAYLYDAYGRQTVIRPGSSGIVLFNASDLILPGGVSGVGNPFLFTGRRLDGETDLYYYRARYYDPVDGRFLTRDPIGVWTDAHNYGNGYAYVGDDPIARLDPMGLVGPAAALPVVKEAAPIIVGGLEAASHNNLEISGDTAACSTGKKGCFGVRRFYVNVASRSADNGYGANVYKLNVKIYFKYDGCNVIYVGVTTDDSDFLNGLYGKVKIKGQALGAENPVASPCKGTADCCDEACCVEYQIRVDEDYSWYVIGHNDTWGVWKYVFCGNGTLKKTYQNLSPNASFRTYGTLNKVYNVYRPLPGKK